MQIVERFVLAKLRNRTFFSLAELNAAIRDCVAAINARIMRHVGKSRAELLEMLDRPALKALPNASYAYAEWQRARGARLSYRDRRPPHHRGAITTDTVEIFHKGKRIASHARSHLRHRHTTTAGFEDRRDRAVGGRADVVAAPASRFDARRTVALDEADDAETRARSPARDAASPS